MVETIERPETVTNTNTHHIPRYKVIFHDDETTTQRFVTWLLCKVFNKSENDARKIMLEVHNTGAGIAGVYPLEVAEMRQDLSMRLARANKFPLQVSLEPDE